jgi:hypothetical protein
MAGGLTPLRASILLALWRCSFFFREKLQVQQDYDKKTPTLGVP